MVGPKRDGGTSRRKIAADDFFTGMFETALEPDEIVTAVHFALPDRAHYIKFRHPASGYAVVGVMIAQFGKDVRVAVTGAAASVFRVPAMEAALAKSFTPQAIADITVPADVHAGRYPLQRRISRAPRYGLCAARRRSAGCEGSLTMKPFAIGESVPRFEDRRLLRGGGQYLDDVKLPGMAHGCVLRSPHPHARIRKIDISAALAMRASSPC